MLFVCPATRFRELVYNRGEKGRSIVRRAASMESTGAYITYVGDVYAGAWVRRGAEPQFGTISGHPGS